MADDGNDWELVSLTASTYAAAPGPILPQPDADKRDAQHLDLKSDSPTALFMSAHSSFPTKEGVRPLTEPDCKAGTHEVCGKEFSSAMMADDIDLDSSRAKCKLDHDLPGFSFLHNTVSLDDVVFGDGMGLRGLSLAGEEQPMFRTSSLDSPDTGSDILLSRKARHAADPATEDIADPAVPSHPAGAAPLGSAAAAPEDVHNGKDQSKAPSEPWWNKTFSFLCNSAKESVTFQLFFVAATIVGLAILGQRWQREKLQCQKFGLQFNDDSEKMVAP